MLSWHCQLASRSASGLVARPFVVLMAAIACGPAANSAGATPRGALRQRSGAAGCLAPTPRRGCMRLRAARGITTLALSSDGRSVYLAGAETETIVVLARDPRSGRLRQLRGVGSCVSAHRRGGCRVAGALAGTPASISVTRDGRNVYVVEQDDDIAVLTRDPRSGRLEPLVGAAGCV